MRPRFTSLVRLSFLVLIYFFARSAVAQIHAVASVETASKVHSEDSGVTAFLNLCVQGTATYPCPPSIDNTPYSPSITYTYGQILDGVVGATPRPSNGIYTITANGILFCTIAVATSTACPPASTIFDAGTYVLYAYYNAPDGSAPVQSPPVNVTVLQDTVATFTLTSSMNPAPVGTAVTFTAVALGTYGEPATGTIAFTDGTNAVGSGTLDATGTAHITTSALAIGTHTIHASYPGSVDLAAPPDAVLQQVIVPPMTATTLTSSVNPSAFGQSVTFTASVGTASPALRPSGAVSFNDGTKTFATVLVSPQGVAPTSISTLASGTHNITANYSGDAATGPSVSPVLVQQVDYPLTEATPGFIVTVTPSPVVLGVGLIANLTVAVTPRSGFSQPVTLTCANLPHESTCTFGQTVIPAGGGMTSLDLHVSSPHDCGSNVPYFYGANRPGQGVLRYGGPVLAGAILLLLPRRRRRLRGLLALCAAIGLVGLSGCSSACTDFGTYPGSYTFKVIGTAPSATSGASAGSGTPLVVPVSVALTVKI